MKLTRACVAPFLILVVFAAFDGNAIHVVAAEENAVVWQHDADVAWRAARDSGRSLLLVFTSDNCYYCRKLMRDTLSDRQVVADVQRLFVATAVPIAARPQLVRKAGVHGLPTTLLIGPDGRVLDRIVGYRSPDQFRQRLRLAAAQSEIR